MATFKCKMCGATLDIEEGKSVATCEYCGSTQTVPVADNEKKLTLFARANRLRFGCEFDKAAGIYESIIQDFPEEAEAYWGLVLCKYGIEYIDDGISGKKIPTCHRTRPTSVMEDDDFAQACENADVLARDVYRSEAKEIDRIQRKILEIAGKEDPYDIFICYKETDDRTKSRTEDSTIAQDIYTELSGEGYRVFFARVSLRSVAGSEYEPYIYAALSSSKVMLAIGTKFEYYDAVWVKNEWSRFLDMMKNDTKKVLIPCFRDMDAYDMPKEFKNLQGLDMGEVTFFKNLSESIGKTIEKKRKASKQAQAAPLQDMNAPTVDPLLKRMTLFLADGDFAKANEYAERVLDASPECAEAYLGKLMAELKVRQREDLAGRTEFIDKNENFKKAVKFGDAALISELVEYSDRIKAPVYDRATMAMNDAQTEKQATAAAALFDPIIDYRDSSEKKKACLEKAKEIVYSEATASMNGAVVVSEYEAAASTFDRLGNYRDSGKKLRECLERCKDKTVVTYTNAVDLMNASKEEEAIKLFQSVTDYANAKKLMKACAQKIYDAAKMSMQQAKEQAFGSKEQETLYRAAAEKFALVPDHKDAADLGKRCLELAAQSKTMGAKIEQKQTRKKLVVCALIAVAVIIAIVALVKTCSTAALNTVAENGIIYNREDGGYWVHGYTGKMASHVVIPAQVRGLPVTCIQGEAFKDCTRLESITIPESVTRINAWAFQGCTGLTDITIPDSVTTIGEEAFKDCTALTSITIENGVTSIGDRAFSGCTALTSITIPDSVTAIGVEIFRYCTALTSITIPYVGSGTDGSYMAFGCFFETSAYWNNADSVPSSLETVVITGGTQIANYVFFRCPGIKSITLPGSITDIGVEAFYHCTGLTSITFGGTKEQWDSINKGGSWNNDTGDYIIHCTDGDIAK